MKFFEYYLLVHLLVTNIILHDVHCTSLTVADSSEDSTSTLTQCSLFNDYGEHKIVCQGIKSIDEIQWTIEEDQVYLMDVVKTVDLSNKSNSIESINAAEFSKINLSRVETLLLSGCEIGHLDRGVFKGLRYLKTLDLSNNKIDSLDMTIFDHQENSKLDTLLLNNNPLKHLNGDHFHAPHLKTIDLSGCNLSTIPPHAFKYTKDLETIKLSNNRISRLELGVLGNLQNLRHLKLDHNPWNCDCHVAFLHAWVMRMRLSRAKFLCNQPSHLKGRLYDPTKMKLWCAPQVMELTMSTKHGHHHHRTFDTDEGLNIFHAGADIKLQCKVEAYPSPEITWLKANDIKFTEQMEEDEDNAFQHKFSISLTIANATESDSGIYTCQGKNDVGFDEKSISLQIQPSPASNILFPHATKGLRNISKKEEGMETEKDEHDSHTGFVVTLVILTILCIILGAGFVLFYLKRKRKAVVTPKMTGMKVLQQEQSAAVAGEQDPLLSGRHFFRIPKNQIMIDFNDMLGKGAYGKVYAAKLLNNSEEQKTISYNDVAAKVVNAQYSKADMDNLFTELEVMSHIGQHDNVVRVLGACTEDIDNGILVIASELCLGGSLLDFLRRRKVEEASTIEEYQASAEVNIKLETLVRDMYRWAYEISNGMDYIASKKVIHADLAARNVLLSNSGSAKITDFGLSRKLYECVIYQKQTKQPLPWRWMSLESLDSMTFSTKSDVWSYGVTCWEIFTLGDLPYLGMSCTDEFLSDLKSGVRLKRPALASTTIFQRLLQCWRKIPDDRPTFNDLKEFWKGLIGNRTIIIPGSAIEDTDGYLLPLEKRSPSPN